MISPNESKIKFRDGYLRSQLLFNYSVKIKHRTISRFIHNYGKIIINSGPNCIDIGPGRGEMLDLLIKVGKQNISAVDINEDVVLMLSEKYRGVEIEHASSTADFFKNKPGTFDLITMFHVLEHIELNEAISLLRAINNSLTDNGYLIIEVPNSGNIFTGNIIWASDVTHKVKYTSKSLNQILRMAGFDSIEIKPVRSPFDNFLRILQYPLVYFLEFIQKVIIKVLLPSEKYIHSVAIYAVVKKNR